MATVTINGSALGTQLQTLLQADDIVPGAAPSYQLCKTIYAYHPLGAKIAEKPLTIAQSQAREVTIQKGPEDRLREAYFQEWNRIGADRHIFNVMRLARVYGVSSIACLTEGKPSNGALDLDTLWKASISFNVFDPLNTAGSLVLNQNPNAIDFQKIPGGVSVAGQAYHRSRCVVMMNEDPLYIEYTTSSFGYVGRSVYQRALFPLKSYIQSLVTDDMVTRKAGLLVAMIKSAGSIIDEMMQKVGLRKRQLLKEAETDNVLQIGESDSIESLNMENLATAYSLARTNVIENIASAVPMPAKLLNDETFAEGFGEGTEDAKAVAHFIDELRKQMDPLYVFFDLIVQRRAWNPEFYEIIQRDFPDYAGVPFTSAFYDWANSFTAAWPSLLKEPPSEEVKVDAVKLQAIVDLLTVLLPVVDPANKALLVQWACDNFNSLKMLFDANLQLNIEELADFLAEAHEKAESLAEMGAMGGAGGDEEADGPAPKKPERIAAADSTIGRHISKLASTVALITDRRADRRTSRKAQLSS